MDIYDYPKRKKAISIAEVVWAIANCPELSGLEFESEDDALLYLRQAVDEDSRLGYKNYLIQKMYRIIP